MYRRPSPGQLSFEDFYLPFGGQLSAANRWVRLASIMPWEQFESSYVEPLSAKQGAPAKSFRMALGALIIQEHLGLSDRETVQQVRENPYLQYFLGFHEYQYEAPFDASMMTHFRHRLGAELLSEVNEQMVSSALVEAVTPEVSPPADETDNDGGSEAEPVDQRGADGASASSGESSLALEEAAKVPHQGQLLLDASVAPADIRYPTDLALLHQARARSERILDRLYQTMAAPPAKKPRTYRQQARRAYLKVAKQRRPTARKRRKAVGQQLRYLRRNLNHIDQLVARGACLSTLSAYWFDGCW